MPWVAKRACETLCEQAGVSRILEQALAAARADVDHYRAQCQAERARANNAVDELLAVRGMAPVTPQTEPTIQTTDVLAESKAEVEKLERAMRERGFGPVLLERGT